MPPNSDYRNYIDTYGMTPFLQMAIGLEVAGRYRMIKSKRLVQLFQAISIFISSVSSLTAANVKDIDSSRKILGQEVNEGRLNLCCQELDQVPSILYGNRKITKLNLSRNLLKLNKEDVNILKSMSALSEIALAENLIKSDSKGLRSLFDIPQIKVIYLDSNKLSELPMVIGSSVEVLTLSKNNFEKIPCELLNYKNLKALDLSNNDLSDVKAGFDCLPVTLVELDLSSCSLEQVPVDLSRLPQLEFLFLSNNDINELDAGLWRQPSLVRVDLYDNSITDFDVPLLNTNTSLILNLDANVNFPFWRRYPILIYFSSSALLLLVLIFGRQKRGKYYRSN